MNRNVYVFASAAILILSAVKTSAQENKKDSIGNVGIGTTAPGNHKLAVEGTIGARRVKVSQENWADFVFHPDYKLRSLSEVEKYIRDHQHLPEIPSATDVKNEGLDLGEMNRKLLQKVEELMLYIIDQDKKHRDLKEEVKAMKRQIEELK